MRVHVHATREDSVSIQEKIRRGSEISDAVIASIEFDRPSLMEQVQQELKHAESSLAVICCGTGMADECRAAVRNSLAHSPTKMDYFEQKLGW